MHTRTTSRSDVEKAGPSRRSLMQSSAAALAAPWLQACGGGSSEGITLPQTSTSTTDLGSVQWMREGILAALKQSNVDLSAISVAMFAGDRVVWQEAFGYANRESGRRATVDTRFDIGSVAKVVAALAVMILRDQGKLSLDQPVAELLPSFSMRSPDY